MHLYVKLMIQMENAFREGNPEIFREIGKSPGNLPRNLDIFRISQTKLAGRFC